jgi:hypothetical protein
MDIDRDYLSQPLCETPKLDTSDERKPVSEPADVSDGFEVLKDGPVEERVHETVPVRYSKRNPDSLGGTSGPSGKTKRVLVVALLVLAIGAIAPFAWNYLESYESTDDAQIDGHIDPLSSRIDGTVIAVHAEDDDRVTKGELLVEIDPRDYQRNDSLREQNRVPPSVLLRLVISRFVFTNLRERGGVILLCRGYLGARQCQPGLHLFDRDPGAIRSIYRHRASGFRNRGL